MLFLPFPRPLAGTVSTLAARGRALLPVLMAMLLAGCIDSDDQRQSFVFPPVNALDFPGAGVTLASDGADLVLYGLAVANTREGVVQRIELRLDDNSEDDVVVLGPSGRPQLGNDSELSAFYWQASLAPELKLGPSAIDVDAIYSAGTIRREFNVLRGSSWMWQAAIAHYDPAGGPRRWLMLDTARRALIEVDIDGADPSGDHTVISDDVTGSGDTLVEPVDFAIDAAAARALVVDRGLQAIVAIDLATGDRVIVSDASTPDAGAPLLQDPLAIAIDAANERAFVLDRARIDLTVVSIAAASDGARSDFVVAPADMEQPEIINPVDLLLGADNRLYVSDAEANGVIEIDAASGQSNLLASPGDDEDEVEAGNVEAEIANYSRVGRLAALGDRLFVSDAGNFIGVLDGFVVQFSGALFEVDISAVGERGDRTLLSALVPDANNPLRAPQAMALDDRDNADPNDDRLLVLDNQLGNIVGVEIVETDPDVLAALMIDPNAEVAAVTLGRRTYLPGGALLDANDFADGKRSRGDGLSANAGDLLVDVVDTLDAGSAMFLLDRTQNALFSVDYGSGSRSRIDQASGVNEADSEADQLAAEEAFEATRWQAPVAMTAAGDGSGFYVVDAHDDTLVFTPLVSLGSSAVRTLASEADVASPLTGSRAMTGFTEVLAEDATVDPRELVFALLPDGIVQVDVSDAADTAANRSEFIPSTACSGWVSPSVMSLRHEFNDDGLTESALLLLAEANETTLHVVDVLNGSCSSTAYSAMGGGFIEADMDIVDLLIDSRSELPSLTVLALDRGNGALLRLQLNVDTQMASDEEVLSSSAIPAAGANLMRAAQGLGLDAREKRAFVFDRILRSLMVIDIAERDPSSGRRLTADEITDGAAESISGQRLVISRGTSLNCQPASSADCALPDASQ